MTRRWVYLVAEVPAGWELPGDPAQLRRWAFHRRRPGRVPGQLERWLTGMASVAVVSTLVQNSRRVAEVIDAFGPVFTRMSDWWAAQQGAGDETR